MGRQGPRLVPFLQNGLIKKMYRNLIAEDSSGLIFSIVLPHKSKKLDAEDERIFRDWYALNGKKYVFGSKHYTDAKQAMTASLRKSDYVEKIQISENKLTYRILSNAEVKEKKRLAKDLKKLKQIKTETCGSDDALSSGESGYGSTADSPLNDYIEQVQDSLNSPTANSSPLFKVLKEDTSFGRNEVPQMTCSGNFDGYLKPEPMDTSISAENPLSLPAEHISFDPELFTNLQAFVDNFESTDYLSEIKEHPTHGLDLKEFSYETPESFNSGFEAPLPFEENGNDSLQFNDLSADFFLNFLFTDVPILNSDSISGENINNQAVETPAGQELLIKSEDVLTEKWNNLTEDFAVTDSHPSAPLEGKNPEFISPRDAAVTHETGNEENIYLCKKCINVGGAPILFCEPQFKKKSTEVLGEKSSAEELGLLKIVFDEAIGKEINGFQFKEYNFVNDHLMVVLKPVDE